MVVSTPHARGRAYRALFLLRVYRRDAEVDHFARFVAHDPGVMARLDTNDVARTSFTLGSVVHHDLHPPGKHVEEVRRLTAFGTCDRLHMLGPLPARLECALHDRS